MPSNRSGRFALVLCGFALLLGSTTAGAQSRNVLDYVLLARDGITMSRVEVGDGDIGVLDGPLAAPRALTAPRSMVAAPTVSLGDAAVCRGVHAESTRGGGPACRGDAPFARPFADTTDACAFPDPFPECDPSAARIVVPRGATVALPPGVYGDVLVEGGAGGAGALLLSGAYRMCAMRVSRDAAVRFTGPTTLHLAGALTAGNGTTFAPQAGVAVDQVRVFVAGELVRFTREAAVGTILCAPQASIRITNGVTLRGRVVGAKMRVRRSSLTLDAASSDPPTTTTTTLPATARCGDGSVDPGEVCDGDVVCTSAGGSFLDCLDCRSFTSGPCTPSPPSRCGDGVRDDGEACDDGNTADCDGCSARCTVERLGNGVLDCDEECDDGNTADCDGCDGTGTIECSDGAIDAECGEVCDGADVGGQVCPGGVVTCGADCRRVDRSLCPPGAPVPAEMCGNCLDDDLDGLVDYEDPACCGGPSLTGARLTNVRVKPRRRGSTTLRLRARLGPNASGVAPARQELIVQARTASGAPVLCAQLPAGSLRAKRGAFRFRDPGHTVASAHSLDRVRLKATRRGQLRLRAAGKRMSLAPVPPGGLRVTVAVVDPGGGPSGARCAAMEASLRRGRGRTLRAP